MDLLKALQTSGTGLLIVFIGLVCLVAIVYLMGAICKKLIREEDALAKAAPAPKASSAPAVAPAKGEIANRDELVAILSAAVAEELGTDVSAIRVVSFKQIN